MTRRRFTTALLPGALLPGILHAAETQQERAKRVIEQCIAALGGDAFRHLPGHLQTGRAYSFYEDEVSGLSPAKIYTKYVETGVVKEIQRQVLGKSDDETVLLTATEGWDITYRGAEAIPAAQLDKIHETQLSDIFCILRTRLAEPNMSLFSKGSEVMENQPTEVLDYYDADNRNVTVWIHSTTHLPVRQLVKRWDPILKERRDEVTRYTKFRDIGNGVMWPHDVQRERDSQKTYQLYSDSVKAGTYPDSMFQLPLNAKIIQKKK